MRVAESVKERDVPVSFADHFSQARLFWLSMSPVEKQHIILAYTFELSRCYEQAVRERQLLALAQIDPELCAEVAAGLGLPVPAAPAPLAEPEPSPALSQLGLEWPTDGRVVGIVVADDGDLDGIGDLVESIADHGMVALVIGPHGGKLSDGTVVHRTFGGARSVEYDALLVAGCPAPAPDALPVRDAKADDPTQPLDPRIRLMLEECYRHAKAVGAWGAGAEALAAAGIPAEAAGIVSGSRPAEVLAGVEQLMAAHRSWERLAPELPA